MEQLVKFILAFLLSISVSHANSCLSLMTDGRQSQEIGFNFAGTAYHQNNEYKKLIWSSASDEEICEQGEKAHLSSFKAANAIFFSIGFWTKAIFECTSSQDTNTSYDNREIVIKMYKEQYEQVDRLDTELYSRCASETLFHKLKYPNFNIDIDFK